MPRFLLRTHARADFASVIVMLLAPPALRLTPGARAASSLLAATGLAVGSHTDYPYPLRARPVLSPDAHATLERLAFPAYVAIPLLAGGGRSTRDRTYFLTLLLTHVALHAWTDWPRREVLRKLHAVRADPP